MQQEGLAHAAQPQQQTVLRRLTRTFFPNPVQQLFQQRDAGDEVALQFLPAQQPGVVDGRAVQAFLGHTATRLRQYSRNHSSRKR